MQARTAFLSRILGLYCIIIGLSMIARGQATAALVDGLIRDASLAWVVGIMTLFVGLAMILVHNVWSGGALPIVVTLIGWLSLVKALLFLFLPPEMEAGFYGSLHYGQMVYVYAGFSLALGAYLAYAGTKQTST